MRLSCFVTRCSGYGRRNERKLYEVDGVRYCHVTQVGKIEEVWEEFGKHCEQVRKLDRPCVNFDFVSAAG